MKTSHFIYYLPLAKPLNSPLKCFCLAEKLVSAFYDLLLQVGHSVFHRTLLLTGFLAIFASTGTFINLIVTATALSPDEVFSPINEKLCFLSLLLL